MKDQIPIPSVARRLDSIATAIAIIIRTASKGSFLSIVILTFSVLLAGQGWAATTRWVNDNDPNGGLYMPPGTSCNDPGYATIQSAINAAVAGDTIIVCDGTYLELAAGPLTINKTLTLMGAQSGVDARSRVGAESIVTDPQGTFITANNVVIDGFTFQDSFVAAFTGFGIAMGAGTTGTRILNNIIQDNIVGIALANTGVSPVLIRHNLIRSNNRPGGASGTGIYTDEFVGGPVVTDVLIEENAFIGHIDAGIDVSNTDPLGGAFNLDVSRNSFDMNGRAAVLFNTHMSSIHDNRIANNTLPVSAAIRIFDNNSQLSIMNNDLVNGVAHAIRLSFLGLVGGASSGVVINQNNIGVAGSASFALTGLTVDPLSHVGPVNAECNWWGSSTGPTELINNPGGTGEEVVGDADYTPWLIAPAPGGPCLGGLPSTSGKVTGGGQIEDPVFSPNGDLLSLPGILVSTSGGAQANFGFVIQFESGDPAPKGNLVYNDHDAGVRIKATSFDTLVIGAGVCGLNTHATFTGTAEVNGVSESLIVEVDDCGEPSSGPPPDTFRITTDTYSNSGALISGNIQIHKSP